MPELEAIVPRPWPVAKEPRCAEGPSVKTMLSADALETIPQVEIALTGFRNTGQSNQCGKQIT